MISSRKQKTQMKRLTTIALLVNLAIASAYAQNAVKLVFSGTGAAGPINTQILPKRMSPGTAPWASLPFEMSELSQLPRNRRALAWAFIFQVRPARAYFASRMGVY
jgi:hypothetical protein